MSPESTIKDLSFTLTFKVKGQGQMSTKANHFYGSSYLLVFIPIFISYLLFIYWLVFIPI